MATTRNISPLRYPGGKTRAIKILAPEIIARFNPPPGSCLISPFFGGGSLELAMTCAPCSMRVLANDLFAPLVNFWRSVQGAPDQVRARCHEIIPMTREKFAQFRERDPLDRAIGKDAKDFCVGLAAEYFAINRSSFSGATYCGGFSAEAAQKRFNRAAIERIGLVNLSSVVFSCEDASCFIDRIFDPTTHLVNRARDVMYLDPPYYVADYLYGRNGDLHRAFDHQRLRDQLRALSREFPRWMMSYNDCPIIRDLYSDSRAFEIQPVKWSYGMNANKKSSEILIYSMVQPPRE